MAEVFKAKSYGVEGFEKIIAIKRILPSMGEDQDFIKMFIDEAKIAGQLAHPNICQIFELGRVKSAHFIAMEYIWGKDLLQVTNRLRMRKQVMPVELACYTVAQVLEGLDYAHVKKDALGRPMKIIHRDCSPQNVLVSFEGEVKLIDFGIAKAASRSSRTNAGVLKGKFGYMSPEQVRGLPLDRRSDIFAVGTVLYESLTGERLFLGESDFSTLERVRNAEVTPPSELNKNIPEDVEKIVMKALDRDPDGRYQWCGEMRADLQRYLTGRDTPVSAKGLSAWLKEIFSQELSQESREMERYKKVGRDGMIAGLPQARAEVDVVSALGEAGHADDPTMLGGPSFDDLESDANVPAFAPRKPSQPVNEFGDEGPTEISGALERDEATRDMSGAGALLDEATTDGGGEKIVVDKEITGDGDRKRPTRPPPVPVPTPTGQAVVPMGAGQFIPAISSKFPAVSGPVSSGFSLPSMYSQQNSQPTLVRDIGIGVAIAVSILGIFVAGKFIFGGGERDGDKGVAALAVLTGDRDSAEVFLNGKLVGRVDEGRPLTLKSLEDGHYLIELTRDGYPPCSQEIDLVGDKIEVVTCEFSQPIPDIGFLVLEGVTDRHRIFVDEEEITQQAAMEPIKLDPNKVHDIYVRSGDDVIQSFRVPIVPGESVRRTVKEIDPATAVGKPIDDKEPDKANKKESERKRDRDRDRDKLKTKSSSSSSTTKTKTTSTKPDKEKETPDMGYLIADTRPWAQVKIDDKSTGKTTPIPASKKIPVAPGRHKVTFVYKGKQFPYWINVKAGKTVALKKALPISE